MAGPRRVPRPTSGDAQIVSFNEWIRIPIPGNPSAAKMQIGTSQPVSAFIDRVRSGAGWQTVAALRTPNLRPGEYTGKVFGAFTPVSFEIQVL